MRVIKTNFKDLYIIKQIKHEDSRGNLRETFRKNIIKWNNLIFDYVTTSKKNILRGFHFQSKYKQAKFVSVVKGRILDCVVDLRKSSKTFGKSFSITLSDKICLSLYVPEGFAHSYYTFTDSIIYYKLSNYYQSKYEDGLLWNDKTLKVKWPNIKPKLSKKDKKLKSFNEFKKVYKHL